jgi:hypothetical protein
MRTHRQFLTAALAALVLWAGATTAAHAGVFIGWSGYDQQLQPGAVIPGDGEPFSHRYNFYAGPSFYVGGDYNHFVYMDYLDRLDRAQKFGYRIPAPPVFLVAPPCRPCGR